MRNDSHFLWVVFLWGGELPDFAERLNLIELLERCNNTKSIM